MVNILDISLSLPRFHLLNTEAAETGGGILALRHKTAAREGIKVEIS